MATIMTGIVEQYHRLCVEKAFDLGRVEFVVKGGLICEKQVETFDVDGQLQFRFSPPTVRISTEHWEFYGELFLYERDLGVARGAFPWLEQTSDYLCLATGGAPIEMQPFRDILSDTHKLPENHPREIWYNEVKIGRNVTSQMLTRASTFLHSAQHRLSSERIPSFQRALWWFRHGANVEIESPLLAYICFFNSLELLLRNEKSNKGKDKPTRNKKTKEQFIAIFGKDYGNALYQICYGNKDESLYNIRNDIDHGKIVELGSGMFRVLKNLALLKAIVVDFALYWIKQNSSVGGWLSRGILEYDAEGLVILSVNEAEELGNLSSGLITL
jgi:hypothetical protein